VVQGDSGYEGDDDESVGDDDEVYHGEPVRLDQAGMQAGLLLVDAIAGEAEHVADNIGGVDGQPAAVGAELDAGDSSFDAAYHDAGDEEDEVIGRRRRHGGGVARNLMQRRVRARLV
jgi:hypothetical protein